MSKTATAAGKKKGKRKKSLKVVPASPDILNNVLPEDLYLDDELELDRTLQTESISQIALKGHLHEDERSQADKEPMFPHELHMALRNQIQGLEEEKEELKNKLKQTEEKLAAASPMKNVGRASELAANRIVELGKKVKELQAQLRTQNSSPKRIQKNDVFGGAGDTDNINDTDQDNGTCCGQIKLQMEDLSEKYNATNIKLCELRNQNQQLRHEYKLAIKALSSEVGEKVNVQSILSGGQGWRGRAQQIISLQQKVTELSEKLSSNNNNDNSQDCLQERIRQEMERLKGETDTMRTEWETARSELGETRKRLEETRTRVKSLQAELSAVRTANSTLVERGAADKKLVEQLNAQLSSLNEKAKGKECSLNSKYEYQISLLRKDLTQEKQKNEQLQDLIKEKDNKITVLQAKTSSLLSQSQILGEVENNEPRNMSAKSSSVEKEVSPANNGSSSNEAERARLMELVGVNARRLQEERKNVWVLEEQLRGERHRCVRLETKLARLELERVGWAKGLYKKPPVSSMESCRTDNEWDLLKDRTELLEEKCLALESRIKTLQQEKDEDNRRFMQIIEDQRSAYQDLQRKTSLS